MSDGIMRFPAAVRRDPAIEAWIRAQRDDLRPLVEAWLGRLRACGDDVRELMHDGCAMACAGDAAFAQVGAYQKHVSVYFFRGARLDDPARLLEGIGKLGRHVKLRPGSETDADALARLIEEAYAEIRAASRTSPTSSK